MELISIEDGEYSNHESILNFLNAVKSGNVDRIRNLLSSSSSSSSSLLALTETENKDNGDTPLHVAVMIGNFEVVKLLLDNMNINIIRHLLQKPNKKNNTVLHEAVKRGKLEIVELLLEKDSSSVYSNNERGESPLFLAINRELYEIASHILSKIKYEKGILSKEKGSWSGRNGLNVMHVAVIRNKSLTALKKHNKIEDCTYIGDSMIEKLLEKYGNDILEGKDEHGWTPLHYAAHLNEFGLVDKFLSKHSLICCVQDNEGMSPLHIAAKNVSVEALESLKKGSGLYSYKMFELLDKNNRTALHVAVESKHTSLVERMLSFQECNYIINWKDKDENTCLHLAALTRSPEMVSTFFKNDPIIVDLAAVNNEKMTVIDIFLDHVEFEYLSYIKDLSCLKTSLESVHDLNGHDIAKGRLVSFEPNKQQSNIINGSERGFYFSKHIVNVNLIVGTIIASITFSAGIQIPGGYKDDGDANLLAQGPFQLFMILNSLGLGLSSASVLITFLSVFLHAVFKRSFGKLTLATVIFLTGVSITFSILAYMCSTLATMSKQDSISYSTIAYFAYSIPLLYVLHIFIGRKIISYISRRYKLKKYSIKI